MCNEPCKKLHKMDRTIKRLIWAKEARETTKRITENEIKNHKRKNRTITFILYDYKVNLEAAYTKPYDYFKEMPLDRCVMSKTDYHSLGIIRARKF